MSDTTTTPQSLQQTYPGSAFVYFIQASQSKHIKVGYSRNPDLRLSQLQTANFEKLILLGSVQGDAALEKKIHTELAAFRVPSTEWFLPCKEVEACVERYLKKTRPPKIYFAGKVRPGNTDYRAKLFEYLVGEKVKPPMTNQPENPRGLYRFKQGQSCVYVGPFAISGLESISPTSNTEVMKDKSTAEFFGMRCGLERYIHGPNTHGAAIGIDESGALPHDLLHEEPGIVQVELDGVLGCTKDGHHNPHRTTLQTLLCGDHVGWVDNNSRGRAVYRCLRQIDDSDRVHAFIESLDCYGTIAEIAYASSKRKPVFLFTDFRIDISDLWFVANMPNVHVCYPKDIRDARSFDPLEFAPISTG